METVGGYELEALIGAGTSGAVWRARRRGPLSRTVALKRVGSGNGLDPAHARALLQVEVTLLADLDHPHIVTVLDVIDDGEGIAVAMPLARGGSMRALLDERRQLLPGEVVAVVAPVADALASAHRRGLVHGDVKPANVLFTTDGEPLLSDFGAAHHFGAPVKPGAPVTGTAPYLDPALLGGDAPGPRSDLYALGVVCYEALVGVLPYDGSTEEILAAAQVGEHRNLNDVLTVPQLLVTVVEQAMSRAPQDRQANLDEFAEQLRAAVAPEDVRLPTVAQHPAGIDSTRDTSGSVGPPDRGATDRAGRHGTRMFGPRPLMEPAAQPRPQRRVATGLALVCAIALAGVAGAALSRRHHGDGSHPQWADMPVIRQKACPVFPKLDATNGAKRFSADLNGDGCSVPVTWDGQVLAARFAPTDRQPRYYEIGAQGDELVFGDWDCDGADSPALYRSSAGEVIYVNSFATQVGDETYATRINRRVPHTGIPRVTKNSAGCEAVRIAQARH